jgi:hypothetical protein
MKEKLNLASLTKMAKKDLQETKGGITYTCICFCYNFPDGTYDSTNRKAKDLIIGYL